MPIYAFRCQKCGFEFEELVLRMGQTAPCPECGGKNVERLVTAPAAHRGSGSGSSGHSACSAPPGAGFS